jgi:hypothetical protein
MLAAVNGQLRHRFALAAAVLGLCGPTVVARSEPAHKPLTFVRLDVTSSVPLTSVTLEQLQHEIQRIWRPLGVEVAFDAHLYPPQRQLAILITEDLPKSNTMALSSAVAMLIRPIHTVRISSIRAWEVVDAGLRAERRYSVPDRLRHHALGSVLGRAIAHEIGHFLLGPSHSERGLMRATFNAREMIDSRPGIFELSLADRKRLRRRLDPAETRQAD